MDKVTVSVWLTVAIIANFFDAIFTLRAISLGVEEANPIMAWALDISPFFFVMLKLGIFTVAICFLAEKKPRLLRPVAILYVMIVAWHLAWLSQII